MAFTPVQKLSIGTGAALGLLALVGLVAYVSITQMIGGQQAVASTNANIAQLDRVIARTVDAENSQRGFVTTGDTAYLDPLHQAQSDVEDALQALHNATEDNPEQRRALDKLGPLISRRFKDIRRIVATRQRAGLEIASTELKTQTSVRSRDGAGAIAIQMRDGELRTLGERTRTMTETGKKASNFIFAGSMLALLLALVALQPLRPSVAQRLTQRLSMAMMPAMPELQLTLTEAARHAGDRLVRLQQVVAALNGPVDTEEVAQALLSRGAPPLVASLGLVAAGNPGSLVVVRALGDVVPHLAAGSPIPTNLSAPLAEAARTREPVVVESRAERMKRFPDLGRFSNSGTSDGAFVVAPLVAGDSAAGVLVLAFADNRVFSDDERAYLATLGRLGGQALLRRAPRLSRVTTSRTPE